MNIIVSKTVFMLLSSWQSHCESSPGSFDKCRTAPSDRRSKTKPDDLGCESACTGCQNLHPPSPFIITQPESWYSFYRLAEPEGRRLSRRCWSSHCRVYYSSCLFWRTVETLWFSSDIQVALRLRHNVSSKYTFFLSAHDLSLFFPIKSINRRSAVHGSGIV